MHTGKVVRGEHELDGHRGGMRVNFSRGGRLNYRILSPLCVLLLFGMDLEGYNSPRIDY